MLLDPAYYLPEGLAEWVAWRERCIAHAEFKRTLAAIRALPETLHEPAR